jgi:hypothetical protein
MSMSDSGSEDSASSHDSVEEPVAQLAKIFKTTVERGRENKYTNTIPWDGKEPGPDDILFIYAVLSDSNLRQMSLNSCFGDITKRNIVKENELRAIGIARQPDLPNVTPLKRLIPYPHATVLHLPSYMSNLLVGNSSHFLPRCFIPDSGLTISFLPYLMRIGKIYGHLPSGTVGFTASKHSALADTPVTYFYKLKNDAVGVISTGYDNIRPLYQTEEKRYFKLRKYNHRNPYQGKFLSEFNVNAQMSSSNGPIQTTFFKKRTKPSNKGGGKTRRKLKIIKRRNRRNTTKRRNKTKRRNTIKRRSR